MRKGCWCQPTGWSRPSGAGASSRAILAPPPSLAIELLVLEPSTLLRIVGNVRSSRPLPHAILRTEPPPHPLSSLPSSPKLTGNRRPRVASSIPRGAPLESDQSNESWSSRLANSSRSSKFIPSLEASTSSVRASCVPTRFIETAELTRREIADCRAMLISWQR